MLKIWSTVDMETVAYYVSREFVIQFTETIIDKKIVQYGKAGVSRFNKALQILSNHDFEIYKTINNERVV